MYTENFPYKICIPYDDSAKGGMYTFLSYFANYLKKHNIFFTRNLFSRYNILFVNSFMTPYYKIRIAKLLNPNLCIVQRVDGSAQDYGRGLSWDHLQGKVNEIADLTVFQSQYGRYATREKFKVIFQDGPVIQNAVDTVLFAPHQDNLSVSQKAKIAYVSFSTNPKKGVDLIFQIARKNQDLDFVLIGRFKNQPDLKNILFTGHLSRQEVARTLDKCHFFLFLSQNETCPNVVLEAMASGLPALYLNSGGTEELVGDTGLAITVESFRENFEKIRPHWKKWASRSRARAEKHFAVDKIIPQYLTAILKAKS